MGGGEVIGYQGGDVGGDDIYIDLVHCTMSM